MKSWIIADSGGTGTTWVYGKETQLGEFHTSSLHPRNLAVFPAEEQQQLHRLIQQFQFDEVLFYGAGMGNPDNRMLLKAFLDELGATEPTILTDAEAAGLACVENEHGYVAILGTGSILVEMENGKIINRVGGLGPELGDEGSAFYFGKLLLQQLKTTPWNEGLEKILGTKAAFLNAYENCDPSTLAGLGAKTSGWNVEDVHRKNIRCFIETHLKSLSTSKKELHVVGSYGYHLREVLDEELKASGWRLMNCLISPVNALLTQRLKKNNWL